MNFETIYNDQDAARTKAREAMTAIKNAGIQEGIYKAANWIRYKAIINRNWTMEQRKLLKELADEMEKGI